VKLCSDFEPTTRHFEDAIARKRRHRTLGYDDLCRLDSTFAPPTGRRLVPVVNVRRAEVQQDCVAGDAKGHFRIVEFDLIAQGLLPNV